MKPVTNEYVEQKQHEIYETIISKQYTHQQKVTMMQRQADSLLDLLDLPEGLTGLMEDNIICDLNEGHAPMRPRYIVPDYEKLMKNGCSFLKLAPPKDIWEAVHTLLIFYNHVPSVTNFPVYVGNLDTLFEPFAQNREETKKALRLFLTNLDRTITDSFCHANIGPKESVVGSILLELEKELNHAVPNLTLKYDPSATPDAFALKAVETALSCAKPSFANHAMFQNDFEGAYAIASCYNGLLIGGGSYTLCRILLGNAAKKSENSADFLTRVLPHAMSVMAYYMDERIRFIAEESNFFEANFLAQEGFIQKDRFSAMYGLVGLAECVNILLDKEGKQLRFGHSPDADALGVKIIEAIHQFNKNHMNRHCEGTGNHFLLHAQVGIDSDTDNSPGCRIPIGEEPEELLDHIMQTSLFHPYFPSGIGDIFPFDQMAAKNPDYVLDIIKGAFKKGMRYFSLYGKDSDVIRITGYLVKRSEMEKLNLGEAVLHNTTELGLGAARNGKILERKVR